MDTTVKHYNLWNIYFCAAFESYFALMGYAHALMGYIQSLSFYEFEHFYLFIFVNVFVK